MTDIPKSIHFPETVVYYESWQMDCCGDPFKIGEQIEITVEKRDDEISYEGLPDLPDHLEFQYEGHGNLHGRQQYCLTGKVKKIFIEYCTFRKKDKTLFPNPPFYIESEEAHRFMPDIGKAEYQGFVIIISDAVIAEEDEE